MISKKPLEDRFVVGFILILLLMVIFIISIWVSETFHPIERTIFLNLQLAIYYFSYFLLYKKENWSKPINLGIGFHFLYGIGGLVVYLLRSEYWYNFVADIEIMTNSFNIATCSIVFGRFFVEFLFTKTRVPNPIFFKTDRLQLVVLSMIIVGNIACMLLYNFYTSIPLFSSDVDAARISIREYSPGKGSLFILQILLIEAIPLIYFLFRLKRKNIFDFLVFLFLSLISFAPLVFYGGRFYFVTPILLVILLQNIFFQRIKLRYILPISLSIIIVSMIFIAYRIFSPSEINRGYAVYAIWADLFPEMRMFGYVTYLIGEPNIYKEITTNVLSSLFPSLLLEIVGIQKKMLLFSIGDFVAGNVGTSVPIRTGLLGESFLAYGYIGVFIAYSTLGIILALLSKAAGLFHRLDSRQFLFIVSSMFLTLVIPYGTNMISTTIFASIFACIVIVTSSKKSSSSFEKR